MTKPQQTPLGNSFGAQTTAREVLYGLDLSGKFAVVTGGYSGIGLAITQALVGAGAEVLVPALRPQHAAEVLRDLPRTRVAELDLADLSSVRACAEGIVSAGRGIDMVINSAGLFAPPETRVGLGWESQFAVNHLGHFALTNLLWPLLTCGSGARVVAVASQAHKLTPIRFDDIQFTTGYDRWLAYGQSKTANVLFVVQLDLIGRSEGVRAFAVHPGAVMGEPLRYFSHEERVAEGWIDEDGNVGEWYRTPDQGAATPVWAATSTDLADMGGLYLEDCDVAPVVVQGSRDLMGYMMDKGVAGHALDPDAARQLWQISCDLTDVGKAADAV